MKMRNKGKVYPSPSSSSPSPSPSPPSSSSSSMSSHTANRDSLSVLKLLPAAILALISVLSLQEREVLAYMITKSMKSANPSSSIVDEKKKNSRKSNTHKPPVFDCECFDCYTSYWFRWDSSPNRELIHQAIEAFEEHLASEEQSRKNGGRGKKREKMGRRGNEKPVEEREAEAGTPEVEESFVVVLPENDVSPVVLPEKVEWTTAENGGGEVEEEAGSDLLDEEAPPSPPQPPVSNHKGLVRKVLPDVVGLLNSRWWSLWSPNA